MKVTIESEQLAEFGRRQTQLSLSNDRNVTANAPMLAEEDL